RHEKVASVSFDAVTDQIATIAHRLAPDSIRAGILRVRVVVHERRRYCGDSRARGSFLIEAELRARLHEPQAVENVDGCRVRRGRESYARVRRCDSDVEYRIHGEWSAERDRPIGICCVAEGNAIAEIRRQLHLGEG